MLKVNVWFSAGGPKIGHNVSLSWNTKIIIWGEIKSKIELKLKLKKNYI